VNEHKQRISRRSFLGGAAAFGFIVLIDPALAFATPTSAEKQAEADGVRAQVISMQDQLSVASSQYYSALDAHDSALASMEAAQARIDEATDQINTLQNNLGTRARSMYRSGSTSFLDILLGAASFEEFTTLWDLLNDMNQNDADMVSQVKNLRTEVEAEKEEYSRQEVIAAEKLSEAEAIKVEAEKIVTTLQATLDSLDAEAKELLAQEQQAAAEAAAATARAQLNVTNNNSNNSSSGGNSVSGSSSIPAKGSVVDYAVSRLGCPYVFATAGPNTFDCSGLTSWCYAQIGMSIGRNDSAQYSNAKAVLALSAAQPGDVLWKSGHVGICTQSGGGQYIHAPQTGEVVKYSTWSLFTCALRF
jgi:peptidoglycan hydrolase CwlO-like protein